MENTKLDELISRGRIETEEDFDIIEASCDAQRVALENTNKMLDNDTLTDVQVDAIAEELELNLSGANKRMRDFINDDTIVDDGTYPRNVLAMDESSELGEVAVMMEVNHETGETKVIGPVTESLTNKHSDVSIFATQDEIKTEQMESLKDNVKDFGIDINEDEYLNLYKVIEMRRKGEKIDLKLLPSSMLEVVYRMSGSRVSPQNKSIAMNLLDFTISQMDVDKEFLDFQQSLNKELDLNSGMLTEYHANLDDVMLVKTIEKATELEKEGKIEQARVLRGISEEYSNAKSFDTLRFLIDSKDPLTKNLHKDIRKLKNMYRDFNYMYSKTKYKVDNVAVVEKVILRNLPELDVEKVQMFMALFCKSTIGMNPENAGEHTYMYYTIKTLLSLDFLNDDEKRKELKERVVEIINKI